MRAVLFNTREPWGGGEQWFRWAAGGLRDRGHEVRVLAGRRSVLADRCEADGLEVLRTSGGLFRWAAARRLLRAFAPDVLLANAGGETRAAVLARGGRRSPRIVLRRGLCRGMRTGPVRRGIYARVDGVVCNSEATLREMERANPWVARRHPVVLHNPVPPRPEADPAEVTAWRARLGIEPGDPVLLSVGRCDPDKGHVHLLRAFARLLPRTPAARLVVAGDGPERPVLARLAEGEAFRGRASLVGFVERPEALHALADALVMPSLPAYESFSNAALEGMAAGLPLVATTVGGFPEMVDDGVEGLLVPPADEDALFAALERIVADAPFRERAGRAARDRVRRDFDPATRLAELDAYLAGLVAG